MIARPRFFAICVFIASAWTFPAISHGEPASATHVSNTTLPTSQPRIYTSLVDALATVPPGVIPVDPNGWTPAKVDVANAALHKSVHLHLLTIRLKILSVERELSDHKVDGYWIACAPETNIDCFRGIDVRFFLKLDRADDAARLSLGKTVIASGEVFSLMVDESGGPANTAKLAVDLFNPDIKLLPAPATQQK